MLWLGCLGAFTTVWGQELETYSSSFGGVLTLEYTYYLNGAGEQVYHGDYRSFHYGTGVIELHQVYEHGALLLKENYSRGTLNRVRHYRDGKLHGAEVTYDSNGDTAVLIEWEADRKITEVSYYPESTQPRAQVYYGRTGGPGDYTSLTWYPSGQLTRQFTMVDGELHGPSLKFRDDGTFEYQSTYDHGRQVQRTAYNEQGNPILEVYADVTVDAPDIGIPKRSRSLSYFGDGETLYRETTTTWENAGTEGLIETKTYHDVPHHFLRTHVFERSISEPYSTTFPVKTYSHYHSSGQLLSEIRYSWEPGFEYNENIGIYRIVPLKEGLSTTYNESGILTNETMWKDGKRSGVRNDYSDTGQIEQSRTYACDILHGPYRRWDREGRLVEEGQYSNGEKSGIWYNWFYSDVIADSEFDWGPGAPLDLPDIPTGPPDPEPDPEDPKVLNKAIRGKVVDVVSGQPLPDVVIRFGSLQTTSNTTGRFELRVGDVNSANIGAAKSGYGPGARLVDLDGRQSATISFKLRKQPAEGKAVISQVVPEYEGIFLSGINLNNSYRSTAIWQGRDPGTIVYQVNDTSFPKADGGSGALLTLDMGFDLKPSFDPKGNRIRIYCLKEDGGKPDNLVEFNPIVVPTPPWSVSLGNFETSFDKGIFKYKLGAKFPSEPFEAQINPTSMGSILWAAWNLIPIIGGSEFGIPPTQLGLEVIAQSDGAGSVGADATTGFQAMGAKIEGTVGGTGKLRYDLGGQKGLVWEGTVTKIGLAGSLSKEVGPVTLIPALSGAVNLPVIGGLMTWFNNTAKIDATLKVGGDISVELVNKAEGITFKESQGTLSSMLELGLGGDIKKIKARLSGKGETKLTWQFPANPGYLKQADATIGATMSLTIWSYTTNLTQNHTFSTGLLKTRGAARPLSASAPLQDTMALPAFSLVDTSYTRRDGYNTFLPNARTGTGYLKLSNTAEAVQEEALLIEQVYPYAEPAYAQNGAQEAFVYVYMDPQKLPTQGNEIYFSLYDGSSWRAPEAISQDSQNDYAPTLSYDSDGVLIAAWERVRPLDFTGESPDRLAPVLEVAFAVYDPNSMDWRAPEFLTDNAFLDHSPRFLSAPDGSLVLLWERNEAGLLVGDEANPSTWHYAYWRNGTFSIPATVPGSFSNVLEYDAAYDGNEIRIVYERDGDGNFGSNNDTELFYLEGGAQGWSAPVQLTTDELPDSHPQLVATQAGGWRLLWQRAGELVEIVDWDTVEISTIRPESGSHAFGNFLLIRNPDDDLIALWSGLSELEHCLWYATYDAGFDQWGSDLKLVPGNLPIDSFTGDFPSVDKLRLFLTRRSTDPEETHLYTVLHELLPNVRVVAESLRSDPQLPSLGDAVELSVDVLNDGDVVLKDLTVSFFSGNPLDGGEFLGRAQVSPVLLAPGQNGTASFSPWRVPGSYDNKPLFAMIDPEGELSERDETDNLIQAMLVSPDVAVTSLRKDPQPSGKLDLIARLDNLGNGIAEDVPVLCRVNDREMGEVMISRLMPGFAADVVFEASPITDFGAGDPSIEIIADDAESLPDSDRSNNILTLQYPSGGTDDSDANGIQDEWERQFFAGTPVDVLDDPDEDGWNNLSEYWAGTSPLDAFDFPEVRIETTPLAGDLQTVLRWNTTADRRYKIQYSQDLVNWHDLSGEQFASGEGEFTFLDWIPAGSAEFFYRLVVLEPQP